MSNLVYLSKSEDLSEWTIDMKNSCQIMFSFHLRGSCSKKKTVQNSIGFGLKYSTHIKVSILWFFCNGMLL